MPWLRSQELPAAWPEGFLPYKAHKADSRIVPCQASVSSRGQKVKRVQDLT